MHRKNEPSLLKAKVNLLLKTLYAWGMTTMTCPIRILWSDRGVRLLFREPLFSLVHSKLANFTSTLMIIFTVTNLRLISAVTYIYFYWGIKMFTIHIKYKLCAYVGKMKLKIKMMLYRVTKKSLSQFPLHQWDKWFIKSLLHIIYPLLEWVIMFPLFLSNSLVPEHAWTYICAK